MMTFIFLLSSLPELSGVLLLLQVNDGVEVDMKESFYVGGKCKISRPCPTKLNS